MRANGFGPFVHTQGGDGILRLEEAVPRTMTVVGAGVIGVEYASTFAAMGTRVTLVDARSTLLPFIDREIAIALRYS